MRGCRVSLVGRGCGAEDVKGLCVVFGVWRLAFGVWESIGEGWSHVWCISLRKRDSDWRGERQLNRREKAPCRENLVGSQNRSTISKTT